MDRYYWMYKAPRMSKSFLNGVENFISVAEANRVNNGSRSISCPCNNCKNFLSFIDTGEIEYHLLHDGFVPNYTCWSRHGESLLDCSTSSNNLHSNENTFNDDSYLDDDDHHSNDRNDNFNEMFDDMETNMGADEQEKLHRLFDEAETPLYKGSRFMKLDVVLKLLNLKLKHGWSDKSFTSLLELLHDLFLEDNGLPISTYQAKKLMCPMGLEVERIHACPNNCMLFRKEFENKHNCVSCGASRYKRKKDSDEVDDDVTKNGPPAKMLWYLPIIPRLKRLFSNENEAKLLCWHSEERVIDGKLRHVADSPQWRNIDNKYPEFGNEMRNIRFGLSSDEINPFGNMSSRHSTWPVHLCIYNLPPWLCMKRKYIMMSLLIQGPTQPGNDIDVYMSPLIDDLKTLWSSGVDVYDAYKKEQFQLRAMIFCTISDFPAYGNLSGYKTKEFMSWFGMLVQHRIPIHIDMCKVDKELFKNLWLETKMTWNIETDAPEEFMRKKAVKIGTNFRSRLVTDYVNTNTSPCEKYTFIEPADWNTFFKQKTSNEFLLKSEKAKKSNSNKKFIPRLGRGGWKGIEKKKDIIWTQLEEKYEFLKNIKNHRSKMYLLGCSIQNKETKLYELPPSAIEDFKILDQEEKSMIADGSYDLNKEDPLIRLLGPEHGGRSRTVCEIIGSTKVHGGLIKNVNHSTCSVNTSCGSGGPCNDYPPIQTMTACELLIKVADSQVKVASGTAWPTSGAIIHGKSLEDGCVKVQVDKIIESYGDLPVHAVTKTDEVETVKDIYHAVVQWPRYALKLANKETPSKSTRMDSSQSSPQRDTATNKETPNKSTRIDSSHSSPQRDTTTNK
ncbi:hypothetical protein LXL04_007811 [Taraxacum kok-saghyz]